MFAKGCIITGITHHSNRGGQVVEWLEWSHCNPEISGSSQVLGNELQWQNNKTVTLHEYLRVKIPTTNVNDCKLTVKTIVARADID